MAIDVDVNIKAHNEQFLRKFAESSAAAKSFSREMQAQNRQLERDRLRAEAEEKRAHERTQRSFLAGLAPGGRRATGLAGLAGIVTSGTLAASPISGGTLSALSTLPALTAGIAPLAGLLPAISVGAMGAVQGFGVLTVATEGLWKVMSADTPKQLATALKKLDPETQKLAYAFHQELHPAMDRMQQLAQKTVLPSLFKLGQGMEHLTEKGKPLYDGFKATGDGISKVLNSVTNLLNDKTFQHQLDHLFVGVGDGIGKLDKILPPLMDMFVRVENLALPFANKMGDAIGRWSDQADDFVQHHGKQVTQFFDTAFRTAQDWAHGIGDVVGIFAGLTRAAGPLSQALGKGINGFLDRLTHLVNSPAGQKGLKDFFATALPTLQSFGGLVKDLVVDLGKLGADPRTQAFVHDLFNFMDKALLPVLNDVAKAVPAIAHELSPAFEILGTFMHESLRPLIDALMRLVESAIPPLIPLLRTIADALKTPLQELTSIVDLLGQAMATIGSIGGGGGNGGGGGFGGAVNLALMAGAFKFGPKLFEKLAIQSGLKKEAGAAKALTIDKISKRSVLEVLGDTALLGSAGSPEARDGFMRTVGLGKTALAGGAGFAAAGAEEAAAATTAVKSAVDGALAYLGSKKAASRAANFITDHETPGSKAALRGGLLNNLRDSEHDFVGPAQVRVRMVNGKPVYGGAARNVNRPGASSSTGRSFYERLTNNDVYEVPKYGIRENLKSLGAIGGEKAGAAADKAFAALRKFGKVFIGIQAVLAGLDGLDHATHTRGGFLNKAGAFGGTVIKDFASPLVSGPWWSRLGAGALAGSVGGLPGAAVGVGLEAGSMLSDHVGGHIADFSKRNAMTAKSVQDDIKNWDLGKVPALLHKGIIDSWETANSKGFKDFANSVRTELGTLPSLVKGFSPAFTKSFLGPIEAAAQQSGSVIDNLKSGLGQSMHIIAADMGTHSRSGAKAMQAAFEDTRLKVAQAEKDMTISVAKGNAFIAQAMNAALRAMGFKNIDAVAAKIDTAQGQAAWNIVQSSGNAVPDHGPSHGMGAVGMMVVGNERKAGGDNVPAMFNGKPAVVAEGESIAVFNRHQRAWLNKRLSDVGGLPGFFGKFNARHDQPAAYSRGGLDSNDGFFPAAGTNYSQGQEPQIAARLDRLAHALHLHLIGISGWRSPSHSVQVGGFADDPHTRGMASDTPGIEGVSEKTLERFGLTRPFGGAREADHIQLLGSAMGKVLAGAIGSGGAGGSVPPLHLVGNHKVGGHGLLHALGQAEVNIVRAAANKLLRAKHNKLAGSFGGITGGGTSGANETLGRRMMLAMGWGPDQWPSLKALWTRESGWNQNARNPTSGAYGIPQALGHGHVFGSNPKDQIAWGLRYIKGRYGSPAGAWAHEQAVGWYGEGGLIETATRALFRSKANPPDNTDGNPSDPGGKNLGDGTPVPGKVLNPPTKSGKKKKKATHKKPISGGPDIPRLKGLHAKKGGGSKIPGIGKRLIELSKLVDGDTLPDVSNDPNYDLTLTMYDGLPVDGGFPDLTNYLNAHPNLMRGLHSPQEFIDTYGNGLDVLNTTNPENFLTGTGLSNQGRKTKGIPEELAWLLNQKSMVEAKLNGGKPPAYPGVRKFWQKQPPVEPGYIKDLAYLKKMWRHYKHLKTVDTAALKKYRAGHMSWQDRANIDQQKIDLIENYLKDYRVDAVSHRMSDQAKREKIKQEAKLKEIRADMADAKKQKTPATGNPPKKGSKESTAAYQHRLNDWKTKQRGDKSRAGRLQSDIVGWNANLDFIDNDQFTWNTKGGLAGEYMGGIKSLRDSLKGINDEIKAVMGSRIMPAAIGDGGSGGGGGSASALADIEKQIADEMLRSNILASEQLKVFQGVAPLAGARMVGAFDHGGVVPRTGMALVHKGEFINPNPQGPFRNGQNAAAAAGGDGDVNLELHLHGGLDAAVERAVMKHGPKIVKLTSEQQGRRARMIGTAPGRGR